jgi:hypothetical protein
MYLSPFPYPQGGESPGVGVWRQEARQSGEWCAVAPRRKDLYSGESRARPTISVYARFVEVSKIGDLKETKILTELVYY